MNMISVNSYNNKTFGHGNFGNDNNYSKKEKMIVAGSTALGVATSCALLAKRAKYSLNPVKMFKNVKKSYLANVKFHEKEVISIGAGSCLGGLVGGYMIDKSPENREAKTREAIMQIGNISIPILTVEWFASIGKKYGNVAKAVGAIGGIFAGIYAANFLMNKLGTLLFKSDKDERGVKATDFSAHLDDMVVAASYISDAPLVHSIARLVPVALMVAGNEVGNKKAN